MRVEKEKTNLKQVEYKNVHTFDSLFRCNFIYQKNVEFLLKC